MCAERKKRKKFFIFPSEKHSRVVLIVCTHCSGGVCIVGPLREKVANKWWLGFLHGESFGNLKLISIRDDRFLLAAAASRFTSARSANVPRLI